LLLQIRDLLYPSARAVVRVKPAVYFPHAVHEAAPAAKPAAAAPPPPPAAAAQPAAKASAALPAAAAAADPFAF